MFSVSVFGRNESGMAQDNDHVSDFPVLPRTAGGDYSRLHLDPRPKMAKNAACDQGFPSVELF